MGLLQEQVPVQVQVPEQQVPDSEQEPDMSAEAEEPNSCYSEPAIVIV